jgi:hemolysin III
LRGWLHLATVPAALACGIVLVLLAHGTPARVSVAVFAATAAALFAVSATFHRGRWGPRTHAVLNRVDHAAIFLVIAGSYTPFAVLLLPAGPARNLLILVWGGALAGIVFRVFWLHAPRWLYTPTYIVLGWAALAFLPDFLAARRPWVLAMALLGGLLYTAGGVIYALRRPNPWPRWFGFHEVFHSCTVAAFAAHCLGVGLAVTAVP